MDDVEESIETVSMKPTGDEWTEEDQAALNSEEADDGDHFFIFPNKMYLMHNFFK